MDSPVVWVIGPSRSGTSMVCGLLAAHGVLFGRCIDADRNNPGGYFESVFLKNVAREGWPVGWYERWQESLRPMWDGQVVGAKAGPHHWRHITPTKPDLVVLCKRPTEQIQDSRERHSWMRPLSLEAIDHELNGMRHVFVEAQCPVVQVRTANVAMHDYTTILPVFGLLGMTFSETIANAVVHTTQWGRLNSEGGQ